MTRFNLLLGLLAALVLAAVALVVREGLAGLDRQHHQNHRILAERILDECERELDALVAREEARPYTDYRFFVIPDHQARGSVGVTCSPLALDEPPAYVLGYLQCDPDGRLRSPAVPANPDLAEAAFAFRAEPAARAFLERARGWYASPGEGDGGSAVVGRVQAQQAVDLEGDVIQRAKGKQLNRGFGNRAGRESKVVTSPPSSAYNYANPEEEGNLIQQQALAKVQGDDAGGPSRVPVDELHRRIRTALPGSGGEGVAVRIDPLVGRMVEEEVLLLERTVRIGSDTYRQGLAIDLPALVDEVERAVLAESDLREAATMRWLLPGADQPPASDVPFTFGYRFAPPFEVLGLRLDLAPVAGEMPPGRDWLLALGAFVVMVTSVGLFAVQRMVATRLAYARRRSDFVAAVTHELKTPLTSIRMYGDMLASDMGDDAAARRRYSGVISAEGERLSRLIDNVLELSRLERDDRPVAITVGRPAELLRRVLAICAPQAEQHGFALELDCPEDLPSCRCDADALTQVMVNLVDNAIKFSAEAESRRVVLTARERDGRLLLGVRDFGPGVPAAQLRRVCEPFYRGERELTRTTKGTGIGLALVQGLVARMGGELRLANHPEGGFVAEIALVPA